MHAIALRQQPCDFIARGHYCTRTGFLTRYKPSIQVSSSFRTSRYRTESHIQRLTLCGGYVAVSSEGSEETGHLVGTRIVRMPFAVK